MVTKRRKQYMMIALDRGIEFYPATEGKRPSYLQGWTRGYDSCWTTSRRLMIGSFMSRNWVWKTVLVSPVHCRIRRRNMLTIRRTN